MDWTDQEGDRPILGPPWWWYVLVIGPPALLVILSLTFGWHQ